MRQCHMANATNEIKGKPLELYILPIINMEKKQLIVSMGFQWHSNKIALTINIHVYTQMAHGVNTHNP